jgi:Mn2+/Fe2+ NRAMP family transporter
VIVVTAIMFAIVLSGKYWTFERITLLFCAFNLVYVPAALWAMETPTAPAWSKVFEGFAPIFPGGFTGELVFIILANVGTTIAPWQIFFQQSAVVDKGLDVHDIKYGKLDTLVGTTLTCLVAVFIIITTGAAFFYHHPPITIEDARQTAQALTPLLPHAEGQYAQKLFAIGLFDAGFLGALCVSLSTSWAVGEVFGWAHSLNTSVRDAPWFYLVYLGMLFTAGAVVLIPDAPLVTITMFVQVVAVTLLPSLLVFLLILLNDRGHMGDHVNTRWQNVTSVAIVIVVTVMSTLLAVTTLFPKWLHGAG